MDEKETTVKRLSTLAQLVRLLGEVRGVTSTTKLAAEIGVTERAIWKAKAEIARRSTLNDNSGGLNTDSVNNGSGGAEHPFRGGLNIRSGVGVNNGSAPQKEKSPHTPLKEKLPIYLETTVENPISVAAREGACEAAAALPRQAVRVDLDLIESQITAAAAPSLDNPANCSGLLNLSVPVGWLQAGADMDLDVLPTLRAFARRCPGKRIRDWGYFSGMVAEARSKRLAGLPAVSQHSATQRAAGRRRTVYDVLADMRAEGRA